MTSWATRFNEAWRTDLLTGCHLWTRALNNRGYGVFWLDGKMRLAHRVAWLGSHGRWPTEGLVTDHLCGRKSCVNPDHLAETTSGENIMRATPRGSAEVEARRRAWRNRQRAVRARRAAS